MTQTSISPSSGPFSASSVYSRDWRRCHTHQAPSPSYNHGQSCCASSRIFVQSGIYDEFLKRFTAKSQSRVLGDPFAKDSEQGPQISQIQFDVRLSIF